MEDEMIKRMREMQTMVGGVQVFDKALTGILFGKGTTMIFMFKGGFSYYTDDEAEGSNMEKVGTFLLLQMIHFTLGIHRTAAYTMCHRRASTTTSICTSSTLSTFKS